MCQIDAHKCATMGSGLEFWFKHIRHQMWCALVEKYVCCRIKLGAGIGLVHV